MFTRLLSVIALNAEVRQAAGWPQSSWRQRESPPACFWRARRLSKLSSSVPEFLRRCAAATATADERQVAKLRSACSLAGCSRCCGAGKLNQGGCATRDPVMRAAWRTMCPAPAVLPSPGARRTRRDRPNPCPKIQLPQAPARPSAHNTAHTAEIWPGEALAAARGAGYTPR